MASGQVLGAWRFSRMRLGRTILLDTLGAEPTHQRRSLLSAYYAGPLGLRQPPPIKKATDRYLAAQRSPRFRIVRISGTSNSLLE